MKWAILTLISIFLCVCCWQMLEWDSAGNLIAHSYSVWGDWSAHFAFISNLHERGLHWISGDNPLFLGMPFQYPFLSHLFTAVVSIVTRLDVAHSTFLVSIAFLFVLPFALFYFFQSIHMSVRQSVLGILLFLFLGGLQAFDSSLSVSEPLTNQFQSGSIFTQIVLFELFPQRAFLFGMVLLLCGLGYTLQKKDAGTLTRGKLICLALFFSLLAWTHLHSWVAMGALLLVYFLFTFIVYTKHVPEKKNASPQDWKPVLQFGLTIVMFSIPLIYFLIGRSNSNAANSVPKQAWELWYPGWAQNAGSGQTAAQAMNPIFFWIYNTGLFIPLAIAGKLLLWKRKTNILESPIFILATTGSILFIVAELFNIQPYFYDNLKLFTYAFLFFTPMAVMALDALFQKKYLIPVALILLGVQTCTAAQDFLFFKNQKQTAPFLSKEEFDLAEQFRGLRHSAESLVLIAPKHNHWITTLTGNPVLMGYPGWLWTWGIAFATREAEVNEILLGGPRATELLAKYPVEYVALDDHDTANKQPVNINFFRAHYPVLMEHGSWHVFSIKK